MNKFSNLQADIFSVFASDSWKAEDIKSFPDNMTPLDAGIPFIRLSIISSDKGVNLASASGVLIVDIFTSAGNGPNQASLIADKLDLYLAGKSLSTVANNVTQFQASSFQHSGVDKDNKALYRSTYSIPFSHFGVL